ncbi:MAG: right-handed parallel beta-helix repeat-containing protein [Chitinispirillaceae bacterium]|nr:right-handed parallel beta-helix repeat-containing protein [Chitinispirillaceae bacterium]
MIFKNIVAVCVCTASAFSQTYYVSPTGSDNNPGTEALPLKTVTKARDVVQTVNANMTGDITVYLRGGRYELTSPISFNTRDGGTNGHRVIYAAYGGEAPVFSGGRQVTGWTPVSGSNYYVADVPVSADYFRQLYVNGVRAYRASSPWRTGVSYYNNPSTSETHDGVNFSTSDIKNYSNPTDVRLFHLYSFKVDEWPVVRIVQNGSYYAIQCAQPHFQIRVDYGAAYLSPTHRFMIVNAFEELDKPGEWYHNRATGTVYYYPYPDENMSSAEVYAPVVDADHLVKFEGGSTSNKVKNITLQGITFEHGNWLFPRDYFIGGSQAEALYAASGKHPAYTYGFEVPGSITLNHTDGIRILKNTVRHMANCGVHIYNDASNTLIQGNVFHDLTGAGVAIGRWLGTYLDNDIPGETRLVDNTIDNNLIEDVGRDYMQATGISLMPALRTTITHNYVNNCGYMGIHTRMQVNNSYPDPDPVDISQNIGESYIAFNKVGQAAWAKLYEIGDNGSIYNYGPTKGTHVYRNYIMSNSSTNAGIYNDNDSYMITYEENVILKPIWLSERGVNSNSSTYFTNNYGTPGAPGSNAIISGYTQLSGTNPSSWPQTAQTIANAAGLEPAYASLINKVPETPAYDYLNQRNNRAMNITEKSGGWSFLERSYDGTISTGEAQNTGTEAWIEYHLGGNYNNFVFLLTEDNYGTSEVTEWKVQRWSSSQNFWIDIMPYQSSGVHTEQAYRPASTIATTDIRLYLRNTNSGGTVGFQEFVCEGVRENSSDLNQITTQPLHDISIAPAKNGIRINHQPVSLNVKSPSLSVFSLLGKQLGFMESIPHGYSIWRQPARTTPIGIYLVKVKWPDGTSITKRIVVVK